MFKHLPKFFIPAILIATISCEKEEFDLIEQNESIVQEVVKDTTNYTDAELRKVLEEELEIIAFEEKNNIVDTSKMEVSKENPKKVYVHYMPWFQSKDFDGFWGQHWTMNNQNPDVINEDGTSQIASHYYPLIGPYSSNDPDLHEYHLLLMKLAGIDGVIFDWYGSRDLYDYGLIKESTESFITAVEDLSLNFSIMYEDRVAKQAAYTEGGTDIITAAQDDFSYINETYFSSPNYMKYNDKNMLFIFGPTYLTSEDQWQDVFDILPEENRPEFLTLWGASSTVGENASGEFLWVDKDHLLAHEYYYETYQSSNKITVGSAYPGFDSFYTNGGWTEGINEWTIDLNMGETFVETLNYNHNESSDFIQIITWNDFGEGTMIEPTKEFGYTYLQLLQEYTGVPFTANQLDVPFELYKARKQYKNNRKAQRVLDRSYKNLKKLKLKRANKIIKAVNRFFKTMV